MGDWLNALFDAFVVMIIKQACQIFSVMCHANDGYSADFVVVLFYWCTKNLKTS